MTTADEMLMPQESTKIEANELYDITLNEVSLVTRGAHPDARVLLYKREVSPEEREQLAEQRQAMPDGSFPIASVQDLRNAIRAIGRAKDPAAVKAHILRRARALDALDIIPQEWVKGEISEDTLQTPITSATLLPETPTTNIESGESMSQNSLAEFVAEGSIPTAKTVETLENASSSVVPAVVQTYSNGSDIGLVSKEEAEVLSTISKLQSDLMQAQKRVAQAEAVAKAEHDYRIDQECLAKAKTYGDLPSPPEEIARLLKRLDDADPCLRVDVEKVLDAAQEASTLFSELGTPRPAPSGVVAKIDQLAAQFQAEQGLTREQAFVKVLESNPNLYTESLKEA